MKFNVGLTLDDFDALIELIEAEGPFDEDKLTEICTRLKQTRAKLKERLDA